MADSLPTFYVFHLLNTLLVFGAHGVTIQLYKHENFTELVWQSHSIADCNNIPKDKRAPVYSIRTDTCFVAYWNWNCRSASSEKFMPGDIIVSSDQLGRHGLIYSFHICDEEEGGDQLNVDITEYFGSHFLHPKIIHSYQNVCSCVNIPQHVQNMSRWSIDNHHNDILVSYALDCTVNKWSPKTIPAGHNYHSRNMPFRLRTPGSNITQQILSFGPDPNSTYFQISCNASGKAEIEWNQFTPQKKRNRVTADTEREEVLAKTEQKPVIPEMEREQVTMDRTEKMETSTELSNNVDLDQNNRRFQVMFNKIVELQSQVDQLKRNQDLFKTDMLEQFQNFVSQFKFAIRDLFTGPI